MSAYEELVQQCYDAPQAERDDVQTVLAEVLRTLESHTDNMPLAEANAIIYWLRASPLVPPK